MRVDKNKTFIAPSIKTFNSTSMLQNHKRWSSTVHTDETTEEPSCTERSLAAQFMTHDVTARYLYHLLMFRFLTSLCLQKVTAG